MNVRTTKTPPPRIDIDYQSRYNITTYGADNLYPQHLQRITKASGTATLCLNRYAKFVEGWGFDERFSRMVVNDEGETADTLLHDVVGDLCEFGGFALHVNYNLLGEVSSVHHVPFEHCRLEEPDDVGVVSHVKVSDDWSGTKKHKGHTVSLEENIETFPVFNPDPDVVASQIMEAGGIDKYKGQVLWCSMDGKNQYPTPIYDSIITDISTDEGLGNIKNRNVRNNFLVACMLIAKKGLPRVTGYNEDGTPIEEDRQMIADEDLVQFQGDTNGSKILYVELEDDEEKPEVVQFPVKNYDKEFTATDESVIERIYAQFHQELFHAIRIGKLGFSGDVMEDAYQYYAGEVTNEQRYIERVFTMLFQYWHDTLLINADFSIQPLKYISAKGNG